MRETVVWREAEEGADSRERDGSAWMQERYSEMSESTSERTSGLEREGDARNDSASE